MLTLKINLKVKKLVSLNPDKYEMVDMEKAINNYGDYCHYYGHADIINPKMKSFQEWLETEI